MKKIRISQSLLKDFKSYTDGSECGKLFEAKWITRTASTEPTDAMLLGQWFEYLAIGDRPTVAGDDWDPAEYFLSGMKAAGKKAREQWKEILLDPWADVDEADQVSIDNMAANYEAHWTVKYSNLFHQAVHLRSTFDAYGIEILETQRKIEWDQEDHVRVCKWDVYAICKKIPDPEKFGKLLPVHHAIIDVKATGLINNRWEPYGWDTYSLPMKDKLIIQPIDYMDVVRETDYQADAFYFFVHGNTNAIDRKIIQVNMIEATKDYHREQVGETVDQIKFLNQVGYKPYPDVVRCDACPLKETCLYRAYHPRVQVVNAT